MLTILKHLVFQTNRNQDFLTYPGYSATKATMKYKEYWFLSLFLNFTNVRVPVTYKRLPDEIKGLAYWITAQSVKGFKSE